MASRLLMTLQVVVPPPQKLGAVPHGTRVIAAITSGTFDGPRLRGRVLPGGGDWTLLRSDGVLELDLRITLETDDGALICMTSFGLRHGPAEVLAALGRGESVDPSTYYFRTAVRFDQRPGGRPLPVPGRGVTEQRHGPFDQPGVEYGKKLTFAMMGRSGFAEYDKKIRETRDRARAIIR